MWALKIKVREKWNIYNERQRYIKNNNQRVISIS